MQMIRLTVMLGALLVPATVAAVPGVTTTDVNIRTGPSTSYQSLGVIPGGTSIDITDCEPGSTWCSVTAGDTSGFVSGNYIQQVAAPVDEPTGTDLVEPTGDTDGSDSSGLTDDQLDTLVAPIALYPDSLLAQVLVAATYPLEIVKAERWIEANTDLADDKREEQAAAQGWDESVSMLAAGFPSVIDMMNKDLDWTQQLGDAVLADNDAVLDAVQRQRARAEAVGNLKTNEAQVVQTVNNNIVIEPAKADTVYVPQYNPTTTYTTPAPVQPVYVSTTDSGWDTGAVLATGAIAFGAGLAISSVFNHDDYRNYWYGPPPVYWGRGEFYPRPGYRPPPPPGWRPRPGRPVGPGRPGRPWRPGGNDVNVNGNVNIGNSVNVGNRVGNNDGAWRPSPRRQQQARREIENRNRHGRPGGVGPGPARRPAAGGRPGGRPNANTLERRLQSGSGGRPSRPSRSTAARGPERKGSPGGALAKPRRSTKPAAHRSASRGRASQARRAAPQRRAAPHRAARPKASRAPARRAAPRRSAIHKAPARRAHASRSRGHRGRGGGGGRRRR